MAAPADPPVVLPPATPAPVLLLPSPQDAVLCDEVDDKPEIKSEHSFALRDVKIANASDPADEGQFSLALASAQLASQKAPVEKQPPAKKAAKIRISPSFVEGSLLLYSVFYAAVSRVPFTLFAIYMIDVLNFTYVVAALTLGLYCFGRLVGAHLAGMHLGSVTMVVGTAAGAVAWSSILLFDQQLIFIISSFGLGLTETVTGLDSMLKIESLILRRKADETQIIFRAQLIFTCLGVFIAYMGGGILYQVHGMPAVGLCCIVFSCINLVIFAVLSARRRVYRQTLIRLGDILAEVEANAPKGRKSRASVGGKKAGVKTRVSTYNIDAVEILDDDNDTSKSAPGKVSMATPPQMKTGWFLGTVVACFFFTTLGISTQFAISALYWKRVWSVSPDVVGTIMAIGECLGVCCLIFLGQPKVFNSPVTKYFGKPVNVLCACMGMGVLCFLITVDNRLACAIGSVGVHMCNVCVHSFQAELVGVCASGEKFAKWISLSYVVKRAANCVCVFGSIIFFDAFGPQMSYVVIGSGLIFYATVLFLVYSCMGVLPCQLKR